jgi:hypothetical protein
MEALSASGGGSARPQLGGGAVVWRHRQQRCCGNARRWRQLDGGVEVTMAAFSASGSGSARRQHCGGAVA